MSDDQFNTLLVHMVQARANQAVIMKFLSRLAPGDEELLALSRMEMACLKYPDGSLRGGPREEKFRDPRPARGRTREEQRNTTHEEPS